MPRYLNEGGYAIRQLLKGLVLVVEMGSKGGLEMLRTILDSRTRFASVVLTTVLLVAAIAWGGTHLVGASTASAGNNVRFFAYVAITEAETNDGVVHRVGMNGSGSFDPDTGWVRAGGSFEHFDFGAEELPKPALGSGKWQATKLMSFTPCTPPDTCTAVADTTAGHITPGVADLEVDLFLDGGPTISQARLRIICNVGFAGIVNIDPETEEPLPEGYFLSFEHPEFGNLEFEPLDPVSGLTHIGYIPPHELR